MDLGGVPVLVVEDDPDSRDLLAVILQLCGARPHAVGSVREALDSCDRMSPAVVLSDLSMPEATGYDFLAEFRLRSTHAGVPVIAVTVYSGHRARALAAGFDDFITKPVDPSLLCERVHLHLGR